MRIQDSISTRHVAAQVTEPTRTRRPRVVAAVPLTAAHGGTR
jgi:hypothetical protein